MNHSIPIKKVTLAIFSKRYELTLKMKHSSVSVIGILFRILFRILDLQCRVAIRCRAVLSNLILFTNLLSLTVILLNIFKVDNFINIQL